MPLPITTIIQRICPALYSDSGINDWISIATDRTSTSWYGNNYNMAVALRAAHDYTLSVTRPLGEAGAVVSMSEGNQSRSFSKGGSSFPDDLEQTAYGVRLKTLRRGAGPSMGVVTGLPQPTIPTQSQINNWNW